MKEQLVVVGNGMAGVACVEQILKQPHNFEITIFGDETHVNYNRIMLSLVLAGEKSAEEIVINDIEWYKSNGIRTRLGVKITGVDRERRILIDEQGGETPYDKLIIATGSSAFIPPIPGVDKKNVHVFRTLDDTRALLEKARPGLKAAVIGGGLLGLEAARGLQVRGCEVTVIHLMDTLMERQLDPTGGEYLKRKIESLGIRVMLPKQTASLFGNGHVDGLRFASGEELEAELVVIAAGIRPNAELGRKAGLQVTARHRGQRLHGNLRSAHLRRWGMHGTSTDRFSDWLRRSSNKEGSWHPLFAGVRVTSLEFGGASPAAKLKIMGVDIFSAGSIEESEVPTSRPFKLRRSIALGTYKKLLLKEQSPASE